MGAHLWIRGMLAFIFRTHNEQQTTIPQKDILTTLHSQPVFEQCCPHQDLIFILVYKISQSGKSFQAQVKQAALFPHSFEAFLLHSVEYRHRSLSFSLKYFKTASSMISFFYQMEISQIRAKCTIMSACLGRRDIVLQIVR